MSKNLMIVAVMNNKLIYYDSSNNSLFKFKSNVENDNSLYIIFNNVFYLFFKYFWTSNPLGKYIDSIPSSIPNFMTIVLAIILYFYEFIIENKYDRENVDSKINIKNHEKFFQTFEEYTRLCNLSLFKWGFAFLVFILPTLFEVKINIVDTIICISGTYYLIDPNFK